MDKLELKDDIRERLLKKNRGRHAYFLQLDFDEICEVIDSQSD